MENKAPDIPMSPEVAEVQTLLEVAMRRCLKDPYHMYALASQMAILRHHCKLIFNRVPSQPKSG